MGKKNKINKFINKNIFWNQTLQDTLNQGSFNKNCHGGFLQINLFFFFFLRLPFEIIEEAHLGTFIPRVMTGAWTGVKGSSWSWSPSSWAEGVTLSSCWRSTSRWAMLLTPDQAWTKVGWYREPICKTQVTLNKFVNQHTTFGPEYSPFSGLLSTGGSSGYVSVFQIAGCNFWDYNFFGSYIWKCTCLEVQDEQDDQISETALLCLFYCVKNQEMSEAEGVAMTAYMMIYQFIK